MKYCSQFQWSIFLCGFFLFGSSCDEGEQIMYIESPCYKVPEFTSFDYGFSYQDNLYYVSKEKMSWEAANSFATEMGGHIVTINSAEENEKVMDLLKKLESGPKYTWLGARADYPNFEFHWITGEEFEYTNWFTDFGPLNFHSNCICDENYVELFIHDNWGSFVDPYWNDVPYWTENRYVVEFECEIPDCEPEKEINGYDYLGILEAHQYYVSKEYTSWYKAFEQSLALSGHLVTITSKAENDFIHKSLRKYYRTRRVWIGLTDQAKEGEFEWVTNEPFDYANWYSGEPNNAISWNCEYNREQGYCSFTVAHTYGPNYRNGEWTTANSRNESHYFVLELEPGTEFKFCEN